MSICPTTTKECNVDRRLCSTTCYLTQKPVPIITDNLYVRFGDSNLAYPVGNPVNISVPINAIHCECPNCKTKFDVTPPNNTVIQPSGKEKSEVKGMRWVKLSESKPKQTINADLLIRYNFNGHVWDRELGNAGLVKELYENGWKDIEWMDLKWLDEIASDVSKDEQTFTEEQFVEKMIEELPQYGIDTSKWEYDYGDCCYGGAMEFISRAIIGHNQSSDVSKDEQISALQEQLRKNEGEVERFKEALEKIHEMRPATTIGEAKFRFNECWHISDKALFQPKKH